MSRSDEFLYPFALKGNPSFACHDAEISISSADVQFYHDQGSQDSTLDPLSDDPMLVLSVLEPVLVETPEPPRCSKSTVVWNEILESSNSVCKRGRTARPSSFLCSFPGCHKEFTRNSYLKIHLRIHTNEKDFICQMNECGRSFTTRYALRVHERTHTGERPYKCPNCEKSFRTSNDRNVHERSHTDVRPYPCESCDLAFRTLNQMKCHVKSVHEKSREHGCEVCGKRFSHRWNLTSHMNIHLNVKQYVCAVPECRKTFVEYSSLYKHRFIHAVGPALQCQVCDTSFETKFELINHKKVCELEACKRISEISCEQANNESDAILVFPNLV